MHDDQNSFAANDSTFASTSRINDSTMTMSPGSHSFKFTSAIPNLSAENSKMRFGNSSRNIENSMYTSEIMNLHSEVPFYTALSGSTFHKTSSINANPVTSSSFLRPNSASGRPEKDRFIPRSTKSGLRTPGQAPGVLADVFGMRNDRVLDFGGNAPLQRKFAPESFLSQYTNQPSHAKAKFPPRYISTKPEKISDAPGLVDDFYLNVLDWSGPADIMAIGLGSTVYAWNPRSGDASVIGDISDPEMTGNSSASNSSSSHTPIVTALKWSKEDSCLAVSTSHGQVQLWDASTSTLLRVMKGGRRDRIACLSWNDHLSSAGGRDSSIWNHDVRLKKHKVAESRGHTGEVCGLNWRPSDGRILASGGNDNLVNLWDARISSTPHHQLTQHQAAVKASAWCPWQMNSLASGGGSADQQINFWNSTTGHNVKQIRTGAQVTSLHWSDEYQEIAATLGYPRNSIEVWSYPTLEPRAAIPSAHDARILAATLSSDGQTLVSCSGDESIKMWSLFAASRKRSRNQLLGSLTVRRV